MERVGEMDTGRQRNNDWFFEMTNPDGPSYLEELHRMSEPKGIEVQVMDLRSGDVAYHPLVGQNMFIARSQHPIWPELQAVVWCSPKGELQIDALSPRQVLPTPIINREETQKERGQRFREWYLDRVR